jgi:threonine aldolase
MTSRNFCSDNVAGASPEIIAALGAAATGAMTPYGADPISKRVQQRLCDLFETELTAYFVATGTAANALALASLCPPHGSVYCHRESHVNADECGAPEFFTGGAKLIDLEGAQGKLHAADLERELAKGWAGVEHHVQPAAVSVTQASEAGTLYTLDELRAIAKLCASHNLALHMDGARFANALDTLNCSPADASWRVGVDVLSFGATKNGAMAAEAVLFFNPDIAAQFRYRRKRAGHLFSKMRFLSIQWDAYLTDDLWRRNAAHANAMAQRLAAGLATGLANVTPASNAAFLYPVEANEIFVNLPNATRDALIAAGFAFYPWADGGPQCHRLVTAFDTDPADVDAFIEVAKTVSGPTVRKTAP